MSQKIVPSFVPDFQSDLIDAIEDAKLKGKRIQISMPRQMGRMTAQRILSARPVGPVIVHKSRACGPTRIGKIDGQMDLVGLAVIRATTGRIELTDVDYAAIEARVLAHAAFQVEIVHAEQHNKKFRQQLKLKS